jgi:hypothetical protein
MFVDKTRLKGFSAPYVVGQKELQYYKIASMASNCSKSKTRQQDDGGGKTWVHELRSFPVRN